MKTGDYVRTKKGGIGKIVKIEPFMNKTHIFLDSKQGDITFYTNEKVLKVNSEESIIKSSPNIIDLIEVGDFIKYNPVQNHYAKKITLYKAIKDERDLLFLKYQLQNDKLKILSIVTREMFESMEYKVESEVN